MPTYYDTVVAALQHAALATPSFVVDAGLLDRNGKILQDVAQRAGCKILLAQKACSMFAIYPQLCTYLAGTTASGLHEARLGWEHFGSETHVYSPAYRPAEFDALLQYADHFVFNSPQQVAKYAQRAKNAGKQVGLRINPQHSTQADAHAIYDPCAVGSRLGTTLANFDPAQLSLLDGLHFHTLCEQGADALQTTLTAFELQFGQYLHQLQWVNLGGGHHITKDDYDRDLLVSLIQHLRTTYEVEVYLEPGEAVVLGAGFLVTEVLETLHNGMDIALVDTSAACHMPDVLEMPYRPPLYGSAEAGQKAHTYRLGAPTCLAGDIIGDYAFDAPLCEGDRLIFEDMALYTMVKTNTFNGMPLPDLVLRHLDGSLEVVRRFGYEDFKSRLS